MDDSKYGFAPGNASGRNGQTYSPRWFCGGGQREHGGQVFGTVIDGRVSCDWQTNRIQTARSRRRWTGILAFPNSFEQTIYEDDSLSPRRHVYTFTCLSESVRWHSETLRSRPLPLC